MNEKELVQDEEVSLFVLWEKLRSGWRYVVGGTALGVVVAGLAIAVLPPKYEATAVVQVGQVGQVGQATSISVEPPTQAIERMKTLAFQVAVAERLGDLAWVADVSNSSSAMAKYLSLQLIKSSVIPGDFKTVPLIELKTFGDSADRSKKIAEAVVAELANREAEMAKPMIDKMRQDLSITKEKLSSAEKELEGLNKMIANVGAKDERFTQLSLIATLRVQKEAEVFGQRQAIMAYEMALMPPATQVAKTIEAVFVVDKPVAPKKPFILALGLIGGLLAGIGALFVVDASRRAKEHR